MHKNSKTYNNTRKSNILNQYLQTHQKQNNLTQLHQHKQQLLKKQFTPISHTLATTINKQTGTSGTPPPPSPSPPHNNTPTSSPDSSPNRMSSLRDRAIFFPQTTFDGKDKFKTHTHLQSFEDFVDRQKLDPATEFKEIQEYFLMTL